MHYLLHIVDDAENFQTSLSLLSAFWGESFIGSLKKLVMSPYKPLAQIINRLNELKY